MYTSQASFAGGEISPELQARTDLQKYQTSLATLKNFIVHPQGGVSNRPGFEDIYETKESLDSQSRVVPFIFSDEQAYVLEFGDDYVRFYTEGGIICEDVTTTPYEVETPYSADDIWNLQFTQSEDTLYICHSSYRPKKLVRSGNTSWSISNYNFKNGPFLTENDEEDLTITPSGTSGTITLTAADDLFESGHVGGLWQIKQWIDSNSASGSFSSSGSYSSSITCKGTWRFITHGTWTGAVLLQCSYDDGSTWLTLRSVTSSNDYNITTNGDIDADDGCLLRVYCKSYSSDSDDSIGYYVSVDPYVNLGVVEITAYTSATEVTAEVITDLVDTNATDWWAEGAWSDKNGWPCCCTFYQDRLCFASNDERPQTYWMSNTGDYPNFLINTEVEDTDTISNPLNSRQMNKIRSMAPLLDSIVALTNSSCWTIEPASEGALTPANISQKQQLSRGSSSIDPVMIDNKVIFIDKNGNAVRYIGYEYSAGGYVGEDISVLATHLFKNYAIVDMAYEDDLDSIVWMVRSDGELIGMTYLPSQQVLAFHHHDTDGEFESVCCIPGDGYVETWVIVKRDNGRFVERLAKRATTSAASDYFCVDCGVTYDGDATDSISGLDDLEGKTVAILADGFVIPNQEVVDGTITLPISASVVHIGLPYTCDFETLNIEIQDNNGTIQSRKAAIPEVTIRFQNSRGGYVGPDEDHLDELVQRTDEKLGEAIELKTESKRITLQSSREYLGGKIFYRQTDPLPVTILSVVPKVVYGQ